jgi:NTE family protein
VTPRHSDIGLVLGGGGAVGHGFLRGVLAALEDATGFDPRAARVIVGTSSGATTAALVRAGLTGRDLAARACGGQVPGRLERVEDMGGAGNPGQRRPAVPSLRVGPPASLRGFRAAMRQPACTRAGAVAAALLPCGSMPTRAHDGPFGVLFPAGWPGDDLWISAVRVDDASRVMFGRSGDPQTDLPTAVAASCALPGLFRPVVVDESRYIDGAAWSATNADVLADERLDLVIVVAPMSHGGTPFHRLHRRYLRQEVGVLRRAGTPVVTIEPTRRDVVAMGPDVMDRRRRDPVTREVRESTRRRLLEGDLAEVRELVRRT